MKRPKRLTSVPTEPLGKQQLLQELRRKKSSAEHLVSRSKAEPSSVDGTTEFWDGMVAAYEQSIEAAKGIL